MRLHRIYTDLPLNPEAEVPLRGGAAHYLTRVLRVTPGQALTLFNGDGSDYQAEVISSGKRELLARVLNRQPARPESPLRITLVQALSRGERMEQTLRKATELGASAFRPLLTERVELKLRPDKLQKRLDHWRKVVISACEQCGRAVVPPVSEPLDLQKWLDEDNSTCRLMLEPGSETALARLPSLKQVEVLVGPEGGFSARELALACQGGVQPVSLGPRILRTETAGAAAIAVLQATSGDFQ